MLHKGVPSEVLTTEQPCDGSRNTLCKCPRFPFSDDSPDGQKADDDMDIASPHATFTGLTRPRDASQKPLDSYSWHELAKGWRRGEG